ncbi:protein FAM227B [Microtus ochrogaster]|uniref:Protein FAM227B n=1 Tax=Microtus ochrogaster TaxID=79684 RepID=A0ABM1ATQ9_MICOH|nr:protein FAM227B [Microtus ochrogaster]
MAGQVKVQWWQQKPAPLKCLDPPKTYEEFLKSQNWDYWPRDIHFRDYDIWEDALRRLEEDTSFDSVYSSLWSSVPRTFEAVSNMEFRLRECSWLLQQHSSNLFECSGMISKKSSHINLEKYKAFLKEHCRQRKIMLSDEMETEKNIEGCNFSGFKENELTQLPRHLDAKQIYLFILRNNNFEEKIFKVWKTYFLSDSSIALLHDSFWWWFLNKFKPDRRDQDFLFDRISESYVTLFMRIPHRKKDAFFQVYPDCLAQAIYAAFQESFPESSDLFNSEFKEELGNTIFLWLSGVKPQTGFWTRWRLSELCTTTIHGSKRAPLKSVKKRIISSQERIGATIDFNVATILKNPRAHTTSVLKEESTASKVAAKSHYRSFGPEFHRVLFNFGGQSPLILYYLKMHETGGISVTHNKKGSKFTKILREPPPATTYCEIIKEAKRKFAKNQKDFRRAKQRIREDIKALKEQQEKIEKELDRLQAKASKSIQEVKTDFENFLHKMRMEAKFKEEFGGSSTSRSSGSPQTPQSPQSSSSSSTAMSEGFSYVEEG